MNTELIMIRSKPILVKNMTFGSQVIVRHGNAKNAEKNLNSTGWIMTNSFKEGLKKGYVLGCLVGLILSVAFLTHSVVKLQDQIDSMHQRIEVITQQLQEMNRYVQYPGG